MFSTKVTFKSSANALLQLARLARFVAVAFVFYLLYKFLLEQVLDGSELLAPLFLLWIISAYIVMPRIHRILTTYYLPNYFVGRVRSPSGFLSDPVNIALFGNAKNIHRAMKKAGWSQADRLTIKTTIRAAYASLLRKSYPTAPVGNMYLFNRKQDFAYEIQINGTPNERHHVRFWKTPKDWRLPGGHRAEWLAAATYDTHVGIKIATGQIDHFIHENIDEERDFTVASLQAVHVISKITVVEHFTDAYHDKNNGGDKIKTDGSLPFIHL
jgi:hypothetical protein